MEAEEQLRAAATQAWLHVPDEDDDSSAAGDEQTSLAELLSQRDADVRHKQRQSAYASKAPGQTFMGMGGWEPVSPAGRPPPEAERQRTRSSGPAAEDDDFMRAETDRMRREAGLSPIRRPASRGGGSRAPAPAAVASPPRFDEKGWRARQDLRQNLMSSNEMMKAGASVMGLISGEESLDAFLYEHSFLDLADDVVKAWGELFPDKEPTKSNLTSLNKSDLDELLRTAGVGPIDAAKMRQNILAPPRQPDSAEDHFERHFDSARIAERH